MLKNLTAQFNQIGTVELSIVSGGWTDSGGDGWYRRFNDTIWFSTEYYYTGAGGANPLILGGLPYIEKLSIACIFNCMMSNLGTNNRQLICKNIPATDQIEFYYTHPSTGGLTVFNGNNLNGAGYIYITGFYVGIVP